MSLLFLKNPHSILAVLSSRPRDVTEVLLPKENQGAWAEIRKVCEKNRVKLGNLSHPVKQGKSLAGAHPQEGAGRTGGAGAWIKPREPLPVEQLFAQSPQTHSVWVALDCLQDPQNVGAIFRTAAFFGVQGILLTSERSAPLSSVVYDIASGGVESVPFAVETNLRRSLEVAKDAGLWILGTSEHVRDSYLKIQADRSWLVVLGNEERGMRRLTEDTCDVKCGILPQSGQVTSLNVSVAAGILIAHLTQDRC